MFACFHNFNQKQMQSLRRIVRVELMKLSAVPSTIDLVVGANVVCTAGPHPALWMIYGRKETRFETDAVRNRIGERDEYNTLWGHMTAAEKKAELVHDLKHRYDVAPYALRIDLLDRLIAYSVTELNKSPETRAISKVQPTKLSHMKPKGVPQYGIDDDTDDVEGIDGEESPLPSRLGKRKRETPKVMFRDVVIIVEEEGEEDQMAPMSVINSGAAVGSKRRDVSIEDVELDLLWRFLGKNKFKYWLTWDHRGTTLGITNDTRLREMIKHQMEIADEGEEGEEGDGLPVYSLRLRRGRAPIDDTEW